MVARPPRHHEPFWERADPPRGRASMCRTVSRNSSVFVSPPSGCCPQRVSWRFKEQDGQRFAAAEPAEQSRRLSKGRRGRLEHQKSKALPGARHLAPAARSREAHSNEVLLPGTVEREHRSRNRRWDVPSAFPCSEGRQDGHIASSRSRSSNLAFRSQTWKNSQPKSSGGFRCVALLVLGLLQAPRLRFDAPKRASVPS